jgi:hypothetical protein
MSGGGAFVGDVHLEKYTYSIVAVTVFMKTNKPRAIHRAEPRGALPRPLGVRGLAQDLFVFPT